MDAVDEVEVCIDCAVLFFYDFQNVVRAGFGGALERKVRRGRVRKVVGAHTVDVGTFCSVGGGVGVGRIIVKAWHLADSCVGCCLWCKKGIGWCQFDDGGW